MFGKYFVVRLICLIVFFVNSAICNASSSNVPPIFVGGSYVLNNNQTHPLLAVSFNEGRSFWLIKNIRGFPTEGYPVVPGESSAVAKIISLSCFSNYCAAIGRHSLAIPFLFSSYDRGVNWFNQTNIVDFPTKDLVQDVNCIDKQCVMIGSRVIFASRTEGRGWSKATINGLPSSTSHIFLRKSYCYRNVCHAVGYRYENGYSNEYPLIISSKDYGVTWSFMANDVPASAMNEGGLYDVNCNADNICMAVGQKDRNLLLLVNRVNSPTWSMIKEISGLPKFNSYTLQSISCTGKKSIAFGNYQTKDLTYPLLLINEDPASSNWSYIPNIPKIASTIFPLLPKQVYCDGNTCIAIGTVYNNEKSMQTVLLVSNSNLQQWTQIQNFFNFPLNVTKMFFRSVHIKGKVAVITGSYYQGAQIWPQPLILASHDSGHSWTFSRIDGLPNGVKRGAILSSWM